MWRSFSRIRSDICVVILALAALLGVVSAKAQERTPSFKTRGHNRECRMSFQCGWAHFCIDVPCEVSLAEFQQGCLPGWVHECLFMGCYNPFWGNCSGC